MALLISIAMKLSENFTLEELVASSTAKERDIPNVPDVEQIVNLCKLCIMVLQPIRDKLKTSIRVKSGFRSEALNKIVGGAVTSQHLKGEAADIICNNNKLLWNTIVSMIQERKIVVGQLIDEKNLSWIHISLPTQRHNNQILRL